MVDWIKKSPGWSSITAIVIINIVLFLFRMPKMVLGNIDFLVGLFLIVLGSVFIVGAGHLFTGWRFHIRKKSDLEAENDPKHPKLKEVGSVKNQPIRVNKYARYCLGVGSFLIVLGIILTSI
ncbi:hypothetical protein LASUN_25360 [Lentilactobacillus sunkii]|jgi:hypothetical protein|uniref:DUF3899 domain-containing protein n=2 Tax=Lentilactobacillus sunkii TaxID=481719 RepID=A0A1E7X8J1_9LACO|nr:DUF3899 domain-containing protein [Lentilactobacillus sunkii]OFA09445.1 hypothetical protein LASUN_25360 [Lentilactobacillus sunkii]